MKTDQVNDQSLISNETIANILSAVHELYSKDYCLQIEKELNALLRFEPVRRKIIYDNSSLKEQIEMNFELLQQWEKDYIMKKVNDK